MPDLTALKKKLSKLLDGERFQHSINVEREVVKLAARWGVPEEPASVAGLLHDSSRFMSSRQLLALAKKLRIPVDPVEEIEPKLLHARLSAYIARRDFGVKDDLILHAIERHTIGRPRMTDLDKIVYLADHIEAGRDYEGVAEVRKLAYTDMNRAIAASAGAMIKYLISRHLPIHEGGVRTRNYYLMNPSK